jgi:hypothetical protein
MPTNESLERIVAVERDMANHLIDYQRLLEQMDKNTAVTMQTDKKLDTVLHILNNGLSDKISLKVKEHLEHTNQRRWSVFGTLGGGGIVLSILVLILNLTGAI